MANVELRVEGIYRRVRYTVILLGSDLGQKPWIFCVEIHSVDGWITGETIVSPGLYFSNAEARKGAVELVEMYIDRQWSHASPQP